MQLNCHYSGLTLIMPQFEGYKIPGCHPFFELPLQQLNKLAGKRKLERGEAAFLFVAYLVNLPTVAFDCPVAIGKLSDYLLNSNLSKLVSICNYVRHLKEDAISSLPEYRIGPDNCELPNIADYLLVLQSFRNYGQFTPQGESRTPLTKDELEEKKAVMRAIWQRRAAQSTQLKSTQDWTIRYLLRTAPGFGELSAHMARKIFSRKAALIQDVLELKARCLDFLPEFTVEDFTRKSEITQLLDVILLEKIKITQALGIGSMDRWTPLLEGIAANYTIVAGEGNYLNTGAAPVKLLQDIKEYKAPVDAPLIPVPTSEPQRNQFDTGAVGEMKYKIALTKWRNK